MSAPMKPGDRVRVTSRNHLPRYAAGDQGTVLRMTATDPSGTRSYVVAMDKDGFGKTAPVFAEQEIELDV